MAKKGYISNKDKRYQEQNKVEQKRRAYENPSKTKVGKIFIIVLCAAMAILPLVSLIYVLATL